MENVEKVKKHKKQFSIVELIAIFGLIAVLTTAGIIVYNTHFKKSLVEADKELVNQLNQSISKNFENVDDIDLTTAIEKLESDGFIFSKLQFTTPNSELIFDSDSNMFGILENEKGVTYPSDIKRKDDDITPSIWKFTQKNPSDKATPYSYYLLEGCSGNIFIPGGVDVGKNDDIKTVQYMNTSDTKQIVKIKTNSYETNLYVSEYAGDTINHYGRLGELRTTHLSTESYHEYGNLKYAYITSGRVVAEENGIIDVAYVNSEAAFLQENSGTIKFAYASTEGVMNASKSLDDKYGKKITLSYNINETPEANQKRADDAGYAAKNDAIIEERYERGYESHPNAIANTRENDTITVFDTMDEIVEFFKDGREGTINLTGDVNLSDTLIFQNLNLTFRGNANRTPTIYGNIEVSHTSGGHKLYFENINFSNSKSTAHNIIDHSVSSRLNVNTLEFNNCKFSYNGVQTNVSSIALAPVNGIIGTQLIVKDSTFKYFTSNCVAITTRAIYGSLDSSNRGETIKSLVKHQINNNTFSCVGYGKKPAIIASYAQITSNTFSNYETVIALLPVIFEDGSCQFDVTVTSNTFKNARYLFSLKDADDCFENRNFNIDFRDSSSNTFENISMVGDFDINSTCLYIEKNIDTWQRKRWSGVLDKSIGVSLDSMSMNLETEPYHDYLTLVTGERIKTYTQLINPEEGRTGYTIRDMEGNLYYYYATFNNKVNMFLKEDTDEAYVTILGDSDMIALSIKEIETQPNWFDPYILSNPDTYNELKYFDAEGKIGALFRYNEVFTTLNGNTYVNSIINTDDSFISVEQIDEEAPAKLYISDLGEYSKLILTNETDPIISNANDLVISIPENTEIILSGEFNVDVKASLVNLTLKNRMNVNIIEDSYISGNLIIEGSDASNLTLNNYASITNLIINSKINFENFSYVDNLIVGSTLDDNIQEILNNASGAFIDNNGTINSITTYAKTEILNNSSGKIESLTIDYISGCKNLSAGSSIINNGIMCTGSGNICLFVECRFINLSSSVIGNQNRTSSGGCIIIGKYGDGNAHDGVVINNSGLIWNGKDSNGNIRTIIVYGTNNADQESAPAINISNTGVIDGLTDSTYDEEIIYLNDDELAPICNINFKE